VKRSCPCSLGMGGADLDYLVDIATICVRPDYLIARGWASRTRSSQSCRGLAKKFDARQTWTHNAVVDDGSQKLLTRS
jgi:hypothetical protein